MTTIFDGKKEAQNILDNLKSELSKSNKKPHLASIVVGDEPGALKYQELKKKAAESIGASLEIVRFPESESKEQLVELIKRLNNDNEVQGIMVQLPLPGKYNISDRNDAIKAIDPQKDVDGMRLDSPFTAPVVLACEHALKSAGIKKTQKVAVVGSKGFVGERAVKYFSEWYETGKFDQGDDLKLLKNYDAVIACTGQTELINDNMIKDGAVLIDTGAPKPEFDQGAIKKASFVTPVPGGIGPLTIAYLMKNLVAGC